MQWLDNAWGLLSSPAVDPQTGMLNQQALAAQSGLAGLTNGFGALAAAFAPSLQPGSVGRGLAAIGPAVQQGTQQARLAGYQDAQLQENTLRDNEWRKQLADLPDNERRIYGAMGPQRGAQALLEKQRRETLFRMLPNLPGMAGVMGAGTQPAQPAQPTDAPAATPAATPAPAGQGGMALSPQAMQIIAAEAGNDPQQIAGVTHVVLNRARLTGQTPEQVLTAPGQFEAYSNGSYRMQPAARLQAVQQIAGRALAGELPDPTGGATHFLNPQMQRSAGRQIPAWAQGSPVATIGPHQFFSRPGDFQRAPATAPSGGGTQAPTQRTAEPQSGVTPQLITQLGIIATQYPEIAPLVQALAPLARQEIESYSSPQTVMGPNGPMLVQYGNRGSSREVTGARPVPNTTTQNIGTELVTIDQATGQPIARTPIDVAGRNRAEAQGTAEGQRAAAAPGQIEDAERMLRLIGEVESHRGISLGTGLTAALGAGRIPGSSAADFTARVDQLRGAAFLEAIGKLRGTGAITEVEGKKATDAVARLNTNLSEPDFRAALRDLREVVQAGLASARRAQGGTSQQPAQAPQTTPQQAPADGAVTIPNSGGMRASPPPAPPRPGEVQEGYRFRGGNPGDPSSWERVR